MALEDEDLIKKWKKATLANTFIFYKVMRNHPEACRHLIEMLLKIKIQKMIIRSEETIDLQFSSKAIRLDVFVKDNKRMYDVEMQIRNTKDLPERSRYYQGLMDLDTLKKGETYKCLKDSHVIFICMRNIFKDNNKDLPVYTFQNVCLEDYELKLNDRTFKHFFIAPTCAKIIEDEELKAFFNFLISNHVNNKYTTELNDYVEKAKENMQWRSQFMTWERMENYRYNEGHEAGLRKGRRDKAVADAVLLVKKYKVSPQEACKDVRAPLKKVLEVLEKKN